MWLLKRGYNAFFKIALFVCLFIGISDPSVANEINRAEDFVESLSISIIKIVDSNSSVEEKSENLMAVLEKNASINIISRAALGTKWRSIDKSMRLKFSEAFTVYLVRKYGKQFDDFRGARMVLERSIDVGKRGILVSTRFIMPGTSPISVRWQVWKDGNTFKLIDIIIEDISMLTMEREEIKNRLISHKGDINKLITQLMTR